METSNKKERKLRVTKEYDSGNVVLKNKDEDFQFTIKFDGCVDMFRSYNGLTVDEDEECDYLHICDLDAYIEYLQEVKKKRDEMLLKNPK